MESFQDWPPAPQKRILEPGWAHIFRLELDLPAPMLAACRDCLSADEQARAARFIRPLDQQRFTAARGQMRSILAAYLGAAPAALGFIYNPQGKPALVEGEPRFNLTHSQATGLLAVAFGQEIGVDLEEIHRQTDYANIARRFFTSAEAEVFFALPPDDQPRAFFTGWTRKEAYIKARGLGFAIPLSDFEVSLAPGSPPLLRSPEPGWTLYDLDPGPDYAAALAVEGTLKGIRCWQWTGESR